MRYLGSKQRLLDAIVQLAREMGALHRNATVLDIFSGTAVVGRRFKEEGARVVTNDRMALSYVLQRALVVCDRAPPDLAKRVAALEAAPPRDGLAARQYSPLGEAGRCFFLPDRARAIDGALALLDAWRAAGEVQGDAYYLLLAGVLEGASSVANIAGTYGAYLKAWQPNAEQPFRVRVVEPHQGGRDLAHGAHQEDANALVARVPCDLLYVDPPYNRREYCANYHVPEALAAWALDPDASARERLEASVYGKTGLLPYTRSRYCKAKMVEAAFRELLARTKAHHVIVSYSEEGLLPLPALERALVDGLGADPGSVVFRPISHPRFRSDRDRAAGEEGGGTRAYKRLAGRAKDEVHEWLLYAARPVAGIPLAPLAPPLRGARWPARA